MVSDRSLAVLHAIVSDFVNGGEPVGSKTIVAKHSLGVSAATIRNDMALLEEEQLIVAPHTSSGRIPTDKGYRLYVDTLARIRPLSSAQKNAIERFLGESQNLDDIMSRTVRLLANLTGQVAVIQYPVVQTVLIRHVELIAIAQDALLVVLITSNAKVDQLLVRLQGKVTDEQVIPAFKEALNSALSMASVTDAKSIIKQMRVELPQDDAASRTGLYQSVFDALLEQLGQSQHDRIQVAGTTNLTRSLEQQPTLQTVLEAIEEQVTILRLIQELVTDQHGLGVSIGSENSDYGLLDASLLAAKYEAGSDTSARLGVLGPTRMDYAKNIAAMRAVSSYVSKFLGETPLT